MDKVILGRTGLEVSAAGLGCGGHSRLGKAAGASTAQSVAIIHAALDLGLNFIDTAAVYGTEDIVGKAIAGRRGEVVISTKLQIIAPGTPGMGNEFISGAQFAENLEASLGRLGTDYVDVLHPHGIAPHQYGHVQAEILPAMLKLRDQGKIRFLGLTERFIEDPGHQTLTRALDDDCWDVVMVGFNLLNPSARDRVLARTRAAGVGTLIMFAVRRALSKADALGQLLDQLVAAGHIDGAALDMDAPLDFLMVEGGAASVVDGAYRFCRHEPGAHVILTGTGSIGHLRDNAASINAAPLAPACLARLARLFGAIDSVSGN